MAVIGDMVAQEQGSDLLTAQGLLTATATMSVAEIGGDSGYFAGSVAIFEHGNDLFTVAGEVRVSAYAAVAEAGDDTLSGTIVEPTPAPVDILLSGITPSGFTLCWTRGS